MGALVSPRDRVWLGQRNVRAIGPLTGMTRELVVQRLCTLADERPSSVWLRRSLGRGWLSRPVTSVDDLVRTVSNCTTVQEAAAQFWQETLDSPFSAVVAVYEGHLLVSAAHVTSDAQGILGLLRWLAIGDQLPIERGTYVPLVRALATSMRTRSLHVSAIRAEQLSGPRKEVSYRPPPPRGRVTVITGVVDRHTMEGLRAHRDAHHPGASMSAVILHLLRQQMTSMGSSSAEDVIVLVDCRRYLPPHGVATGNFVTALWMAGDLHDPAVMTRSIQRSVSAGRPLVALAKSAVDGLMVTTTKRQLSGPIDENIRWVLTSVKRNPILSDADWSGPVHDYVVVNEPPGRSGVVLSLAGADGQTWFSLSHDASVVETARLKAACAYLLAGDYAPEQAMHTALL